MSLLDAARGVKRVEAISARAARLVADFVQIVDRLIAAAHGPIEELLGLVLNETGYEAMLKASGDEEDEERLANIQELLTVAREFDERHPGHRPSGNLEAFLEETALVNDTDEWETQLDRVTLMTLHASKGLEFPCVYLVAVEEGLLPHERSRGQAEQLEEERRLMFVGITRAQQRLQISLAQYRDFRGERKPVIPSSFLMELPRGEMAVQQPETTRRRGDRRRDRRLARGPRAGLPPRRGDRRSETAAGKLRLRACGRRRRWWAMASGGRTSTPMFSGRGWSFCIPSTASAKSWPWAAAAASGRRRSILPRRPGGRS